MTANVLSNRISFSVPDDEMQAILAHLQGLLALLQPHLVALGPDNRRKLPKMGAKTVDFVAKTLSYAQANPQLKPAFVEIDEFARDLAAVGVLRGLAQPLRQLADLVDDSLLLSGSEAYAAALACYQAFKAAAKLNHPGALTIVSDLADRFPRRRTRTTAPAMPVSAPAVVDAAMA